MEELIKKIKPLMEEAEIYAYNHDSEGMGKVRESLAELAKPYEEEINKLKENEVVKRYIELKKKMHYINEKDMLILIHLPK